MIIHNNAEQMEECFLAQIETLKKELAKEKKISKMLMELIWNEETGTRRNLLHFNPNQQQ